MKPGTPGFVGARLREAREARSLTAIALADLIGVTRAAVSQYERDYQSPAPQVMRRIGECLNVPVQFFLRRAAREEPGTVFYRCMSAATKKARQRAERRYEWLRGITAFLRQYVRFPDIQFPGFDLPADPTKIDHEQIEELAAETRRFWGLGTGPISNVTWLLENHGAVVTRCELGAATLDAFSEWSETDSTPYVVLGCGKGSAARSRFDAAHELGHMVLHRHVRKSYLHQHEVFNHIESQAHRFAGAFLLPPDAFAQDLYSPSLDSLRALKEKWRVSIAAMIKRAVQLELISESYEHRLWVNLGRRKWRTKEPLDDVLDLEEPRFLRRAMELLVAKGIVAPNEVPMRLALAAHDVEELIGLDPGYLTVAGRDIELVGEHSDEEKSEPRVIRFPAVK